jgi:TrmH family RNA methyltransferase
VSLTKTELKDIQSLLTKKGRKLKKSFLAEGVRLLEEAARHRMRPEAIYYSESALSERAKFLVERFQKLAVSAEPIPLRQLESLADTESTQGILAVFKEPSTALAELYRPAYRRILLCEHISDPGNLGTLIRSALAFEFEMLILTGNSAEPYSPKVVRSSAGAIFGLPVAVCENGELLAFVTLHRMFLVAADIAGQAASVQLRQIPRDQPLLLAVGSESHGLSPEMLAAATARVRIEHATSVESLNAAVAGSILMKEVYELTK